MFLKLICKTCLFRLSLHSQLHLWNYKLEKLIVHYMQDLWTDDISEITYRLILTYLLVYYHVGMQTAAIHLPINNDTITNYKYELDLNMAQETILLPLKLYYYSQTCA